MILVSQQDIIARTAVANANNQWVLILFIVLERIGRTKVKDKTTDKRQEAEKEHLGATSTNASSSWVRLVSLARAETNTKTATIVWQSCLNYEDIQISLAHIKLSEG